MPDKDETPVANFEAERQLIGRLLLHNADLYRIASFLRPEHFYLRAHQDLFEKIEKMVLNNEVANPVTLVPLINYDINYQPAIRYCMALVADATTGFNVEPYARSIFDLAMRRQMIDGASAVMDAARLSTIETPLENILESADTLFAKIRLASRFDLQDHTSIEAVTQESLETLDELIHAPGTLHPTIGLKSVTKLIGPLAPGAVYVIAGRPGAGKTAAAVAAARSIIRQKNPQGQNFGVCFFTLEVTRRDVWNRFVACEMALSNTPVHYMNLKRGHISNIQYEAVKRFSDSLRQFPLFIDDKSGLTVAEIFIRARAEQQRLEKAGLTLNVIVVDYLQIIKPSGAYQGNKVAEISEISTALVNLAKDLNVAVIAVSQLSRRVEERTDKRPIMSDLRESGQIEQDANSIILLYRPAYYDNQRTQDVSAEELEVIQNRANNLHYIVAKARDGIPGEIIAHTEIGKNHISEK